MITHALLDLDGTLTDPALGITSCIAYALARLDVAVPPASELHFAIGPPLRGTFATLVGTDDTIIIEQAMVFYRERFADVGLFENDIYEGVPEMLATLKARNIALLLATAKPHVYARRILAHFDILAPFDAIYGSELDGLRQHKGDLLAYLIDQEGIDPQNTVMIGDRPMISMPHAQMPASRLVLPMATVARLSWHMLIACAGHLHRLPKRFLACVQR